MYQRIEEIYKNKSLMIKVDRDLTKILLLIMFISYLLSPTEDYVLYVFILGFIYIYYYIGKTLGYKIKKKYFKEWINFKNNISKFKTVIKDNDNELIEIILKKEKVDSRDKLNLLISHYRDKANSEIIDFNIWTILSLVLTAYFGIVSQLNVSNEIIISCFVIVLVVGVAYYLLAKQVLEMIAIFRRTKQLYSSLEEKFTEVYLHKY